MQYRTDLWYDVVNVSVVDDSFIEWVIAFINEKTIKLLQVKVVIWNLKTKRYSS